MVQIFFSLVELSVEMHKKRQKKLTRKNLNLYDQMKIFIYSTYPFLLQPSSLPSQLPFNQ